MRRTAGWLLAGGMLVAGVPAAGGESIRVVSRGEMLYSLHCVACHSEKIHWRDQRLAKDWRGLVAEVDRWQKIGRLGWDNEDVVETARHVNRLHYRFVEPDKP